MNVKEKKIKIGSLRNINDGARFLSDIKKGIAEGFKEFTLDFSDVKAGFPNAIVPISAYIHYFQELGFEISRSDENGIVEKCGLMTPFKLQQESASNEPKVLNKVWIFKNVNELFKLVENFINELSKTDQFEDGVLNSLHWCLDEVTDNILNHSGVSSGFIMGQIHKNKKHVAFSIFDYGKGLLNSFKSSKYNPTDHKEAVLLSIKEGITSNPELGAGNGLFGMHEVIRLNKGTIGIQTGKISYLYKNDETSFKNLDISIDENKECVLIDFQIDYNNKVSLSEIFKFKGTAYQFVNLLIEDMETENNEIVYSLKEHLGGFGNRRSGAMARNDVSNIQRETKQMVVIDFSDISLISSSFADEFIGKLMVDYGVFRFSNAFRLKGLNELNEAILQRSVSQRLSSSIIQNK